MEMKREERAGKVKEEEEEKKAAPGTLPNSLETLKIRLEFVLPGEEASLLLICWCERRQLGTAMHGESWKTCKQAGNCLSLPAPSHQVHDPPPMTKTSTPPSNQRAVS